MRRRSNNEGCIYQRSDGRWVVQITLQGKLRQFYFKSNDAAVEHLKELHRQQVVGKNIAASDEPFGVYLARWLTETKSSKVRQNTLEDYVAVAQNHILPVLGQKPIGSIDTATIQSLYDGMSVAGKSPQVIRKTHVLLTGVFNSMLPDRIIERNPVGQTDRPKIVKKQKVLFDDEQERIFLETVLRSKSRYKDLALVYWETGCRISEILGLKWSCVGADFINIENARVQVAGGMADNDPKTAGSRRKVYLSPECITLINKQPKNTAYVFTTADGKPIRQRNWRRQWDQWLITAFGIDETKSKYIKVKDKDVLKYAVPAVSITPHSTRHMQAVKLFQSGWTVADVQQRGGWESPKVLQEIYAKHSSEDRQKRMAAAARIETTVKTTVNQENASG